MGDDNTLLDHYEKLDRDLPNYPPAQQVKIRASMAEYYDFKSFRCPQSMLVVFTIANRIESGSMFEIESATRLMGVSLTCHELDLVKDILKVNYEQCNNDG